MAIDITGFYEDSNTPGFQESAKFVRDMEEEEFSHLSLEFRSFLTQDHVYAESVEAAEIVEQHSSHHLQNELPTTSDEEKSMEWKASEMRWKGSENGLKNPKNQ